MASLSFVERGHERLMKEQSRTGRNCEEAAVALGDGYHSTNVNVNASS